MRQTIALLGFGALWLPDCATAPAHLSDANLNLGRKMCVNTRSGGAGGIVVRVSLAFVVMLAAVVALARPVVAQSYWRLSQLELDIPTAGRANTIAVNKADENVILVASESGGLFRSTNGGSVWSHVDSLPEYKTVSVVFLPNNPAIAIATVETDYRVANGGGIWRSTDRGVTWTQAYNPPWPYISFNGFDPFSANEISVAPDTGAIYVATSFGVAISNDDGASWHISPLFGPRDFKVTAVHAQRDGVVLAGGGQGVRRSADGGASWTAPTTAMNGVHDIHAFGGSPLSARQVFVVDGDGRLSESQDGGDHWALLATFPLLGNCGGITFIRAAPHVVRFRTVGVTLYLSNRCEVYRQTPSTVAGTDLLDLSGPWAKLVVDHFDARDIGLSRHGGPLLLATDGGLHTTTDHGTTWTTIGAGKSGFNALQIYDVASQRVSAPKSTDLYFGTQDNFLWASPDFGATWPARVYGEGGALQASQQVPAAADSHITFLLCGPCRVALTGRLFAGYSSAWISPSPVGLPKIVRRSFHVQAVDYTTGFAKGLAYTRDLGASWKQYATFPEEMTDLPKQSDLLVPPASRRTVLYQAIRVGQSEDHETLRLVRTIQSGEETATASYPFMNNFGGIGTSRGQFIEHAVFAVDPRHPNHLIASDVDSKQIKESWDGGDNWSDRTDLTGLFSAGGTYKFNDGLYSQVSAISFSRDDPNLVAVGTIQAGIFISSDAGATFARVDGSEQATSVSSLDWADPTQLIVGTYGRGLWSVVHLLNLPRSWSYCGILCHGSPFGRADPLWDPVPEQLARSLVVLDGHIQGMRTAGGRVTDVFVSPGARLVWRGDGPAPRIAIRPSARWVGFPRDVRAPRTSRTLVALALGDKDVPIGFVTSPHPIASEGKLPSPPPPVPPRGPPFNPGVVGTTRSPTADKPYIELRNPEGGTYFTPRQIMRVAARGFRPGEAVTLQIDNGPAQTMTIGSVGRAEIRISTPKQEGLYRLTTRDRFGALLASATFAVVHSDEAEEEERPNGRQRISHEGKTR